jgi:hypothetical protein
MALLIYLLSILNVLFSSGDQIHHRIGKPLSRDLIFASKIGGNLRIQYGYGLRPRRSDGLRVAASSASCCWKQSVDGGRFKELLWVMVRRAYGSSDEKTTHARFAKTIALFLMNAELLFVVLLFRQLLT